MNIDTHTTRGDTVPIVVAPAPPLEFVRSRGGTASYAERGPVTYALDTMPNVDGALTVTLVAKAGSNFRRLGHWLHSSDAHDVVHARRLVRTHHAAMSKLAAPRVKA